MNSTTSKYFHRLWWPYSAHMAELFNLPGEHDKHLEKGEGKIHEVVLTHDFCMGRTI